MLFPNPFVYQRTLEADIKSATIPSMLEQHYGQCGEDLIIFSIARALQTQGHIGNWADYVYVEIGGNHAFAGNNTYLLHIYTGMTGILVEANPALIPDLQKARPADQIIHAAIINEDVGTVELFVSNHHELSSLHKEFIEIWHGGQVGIKNSVQVAAMRPNQLFENHIPTDKNILLLSIDVEGKDLDIAKDIDFSRWRPLFVQLEPSEHFASGEGNRMTAFMQQQGYALISCTNVNLIYIDQAILPKLIGSNHQPNPAE